MPDTSSKKPKKKKRKREEEEQDDEEAVDVASAHDLARLLNTSLALACLSSTEVARVTDNLLRLDSLVTAANTDELAIGIGDDLIDGLVEHVGTAVDGAETGEGLWELAETVQGVDVRRLAVASHGRCVEDNAIVRWPCGLCLVARSHTDQDREMSSCRNDTHSSVR